MWGGGGVCVCGGGGGGGGHTYCGHMDSNIKITRRTLMIIETHSKCHGKVVFVQPQ